MPSVWLFVYGSLKRSGLHHRELAGARFLGEAETEPGHALTTLGDYWALLAHPGTPGVIRGELFEVAEARLPLLDEFEGDAYERRAVRIRRLAERRQLGQHRADVQGFHEALAYFAKSR
ncbi:MAG TPA: gamma-glutamylcyclotransferase family protein [Polyangiaceae bacterium]|nr:gamma-glutamylcyclotransferase family protein [Polyangiaceae bacterium]